MSLFEQAQTAMGCLFRRYEDAQTPDTRTSGEGDSTWRRWCCAGYDERFVTDERGRLAIPTAVTKIGSRAAFHPTPLRPRLKRAFAERAVSLEAGDAAMRRIEENLLSNAQREIVLADPRADDAEIEMHGQGRMHPLRPCHKNVEGVAEFRDTIAGSDQEHKQPPK